MNSGPALATLVARNNALEPAMPPTTDVPAPPSAMVVVAHPDDAEFIVAGTAFRYNSCKGFFNKGIFVIT